MAVSEPFEILVIGNSHLRAVRLAWMAREDRDQKEGLELRFVQFLNPDWQPVLVEGRFNDKILAELKRPTLRFVVSVIGGNDHNALGLVNHPQPFDFTLAERPELPLQDAADILPLGLIRAALGRRLRPTIELMRLLRQSAPLPMVHLESPPPNPSAEHIEKHPIGFDELIATLGVAPASLRFKLWRVHSEIVREACGALGIRFVPSPKSMQDSEGMLIPEAWNDDASHGNAFYGERLYRQILAMAAKRFSGVETSRLTSGGHGPSPS